MGQTDLVVYIPVMLQVLGILVEFPAVHTAHRVDNQVVMQVARIDMCRHQNFEVREFLLCKFHPNSVGQLWGQAISLGKRLDEMVELPPLRLVKALLGC